MHIHSSQFTAAPVSEFASVSQIARHLRVHRNTAALLIADYGLRALSFRKSPVYAWLDVWVRLEGVPREIARNPSRWRELQEPLLTASDVAALQMMHPATVRRYAVEGRLPSIRLSERIIRFRNSDLTTVSGGSERW